MRKKFIETHSEKKEKNPEMLIVAILIVKYHFFLTYFDDLCINSNFGSWWKLYLANQNNRNHRLKRDMVILSITELILSSLFQTLFDEDLPQSIYFI